LRRMAFIHEGMAKIYQQDNNKSAVVAVAERNALLELESCPKKLVPSDNRQRQRLGKTHRDLGRFKR